MSTVVTGADARKKQSGHLHLAGLGFVLFIISAIYIVGHWYRKIIDLQDAEKVTKQRLERVEERLRLLELKVQFGSK